jgi:hypothetical protein
MSKCRFCRPLKRSSFPNRIFIGAVDYFYEQLTPDRSGDHLGAFESGLIGVGPQIGVIVPIGEI